jgi:hypothetical protein
VATYRTIFVRGSVGPGNASREPFRRFPRSIPPISDEERARRGTNGVVGPACFNSFHLSSEMNVSFAPKGPGTRLARGVTSRRVSSIQAKYTQRCPNGVYRRNDEKSQLGNYTRLLSLLKLSSLASYTAAKLIEGVSITIDEKKSAAEVQYLTVVPFFDVKETFVLDGMTRTKNKRRDLEKGMSTCTATLLNDIADPSQGENYVLKLKMSWDEPNKGGLLEEMHVSTTGELVVTSTVRLDMSLSFIAWSLGHSVTRSFSRFRDRCKYGVAQQHAGRSMTRLRMESSRTSLLGILWMRCGSWEAEDGFFDRIPEMHSEPDRCSTVVSHAMCQTGFIQKC